MNSGKIETGKGDGKAPAKISPVSACRTTASSKTMSTKVNSAQSKIPKLEVGNSFEAKKPPSVVAKRITKPLGARNASKSLMHLHLPKTARASLLPTRGSTHPTEKSAEPTPRLGISERSSGRLQKESTSERAAAKKRLMAYENVKGNLKRCQTEFMKKWEAIKDELTPEEGEYKLIGCVRNNSGQLVTENAKIFKVKCDEKGINDLKTTVRNYTNANYNSLLKFLDQLKNSSGKIGDSSALNITEDVKAKLEKDYLKVLDEVLKKIESYEAETPRSSELEMKVTKLLEETDERRKELEESQNELSRIKNIEAEKVNSYKNNLEEKDKLLRAKQLECDEFKKKIESLERSFASDHTIQKELVEKLNNKIAEVDEYESKLKTSAELYVIQQSKIKDQEKRIQKLEADLNTAQKDVEKRIERLIGDQASKDTDKIKTLEEDLQIAKKAKDSLEIEVLRLRMVEKESEKLSETAADLLKLKDKAQRADAENQTLCQTVKNLKTKLENSENQAGVSKVDQNELADLKNAITVKNTEIEALEMKLTKAKFHIKKLEEKIVMDRNLLKVRSSLIESLQSKETTQKLRLEDLFVEVGEKNSDIQMLKNDLVTKAGEFENLFSTLRTKQLELTRQEHMIKLLQESNERAQTLRVKQEAKIGRLEEELAHLRQTILFYQNGIVPNSELTKNILMIEASRYDDLNENLSHYVDQRRRKRHIDINVKKYEK